MRDHHVPRRLCEETDQHCDECRHNAQENDEGRPGEHPSPDEADNQAEYKDNGGIEERPPIINGEATLPIIEKRPYMMKINYLDINFLTTPCTCFLFLVSFFSEGFFFFWGGGGLRW